MWMSSEQDPLCTSLNEECGPLANNAPLTDTTGGFPSRRIPFRTCAESVVREKTAWPAPVPSLDWHLHLISSHFLEMTG